MAVICSPPFEALLGEASKISSNHAAAPSQHAPLTLDQLLEGSDGHLAAQKSHWPISSSSSHADRCILMLHSSGSTGLPKLIRCSHRYLLSFASCHSFDQDLDFRGPNVSILPLFHVRFDVWITS